MFGRNYINGSVKWIGVPNFLRNDWPPWTLNLLEFYANGGGRGSSNSPNLGSGSGGYSDGVYIPWNQPARVLLAYHCIIFENTRRSAHHACNDLLMENHTYRMQSPSTFATPSAVIWLTDGMTPWMIAGISLFVNNLCGEFPLVVSVSVIFLSFPSPVLVATNGSLFGSLLATFLFE